MQSRQLGRTGIAVGVIGFGAWGLGGTMWRGVPDQDGKAALHAALDAGVTFIDTALAYGEGHSERLIAEVLAERGSAGPVHVATKIAPRNGVWPGKPDDSFEEVFPAGHVIASVETSRRNLRRDVLDVEQLHVWHDAWLDTDGWKRTRETMVRLVDEGKVRHWGVSVNSHEPATAARVLEDPLIQVVQLIYNIFDRSPETQGTFDLVRRTGTGVIARVPFDEGSLTGNVRPDTVFPEGDWRHGYFRGDRRAEAARRADALRPLLGDEAATLPELALRFCLSRPEVSTVIPGMRRPEHARANAAAGDGRALSPALLERLAAHAWAKHW